MRSFVRRVKDDPTIPPNSGRLDTLQGFLGGPGACSPGKNSNLRSSNCFNALKLSILLSPRYVCIILNLLRSHQADLFGSWGGARTLPTACTITLNTQASFCKVFETYCIRFLLQDSNFHLPIGEKHWIFRSVLIDQWTWSVLLKGSRPE